MSSIIVRIACRSLASRIVTRVDARHFTNSTVLRVEEKLKPFYVLGLEIGKQFGKLKEDLEGESERKAFLQGLEASLSDTEDKAIVDDFHKYANLVSEILHERRTVREAPAKQKALEESKAGSKSLLERALVESGAFQTASGLIVNHTVPGSGPAPEASSQVTVHYVGKLHDGTVFDSSVERGEPVTFPLNRVIPGWTEGVQLMKVGGKTRFTIPSDLAYGPAGSGPIPPHAALEFEVELLSVAPAAPGA